MKKLILGIGLLVSVFGFGQVTYNGNGNSGFGGAVGGSNISINDNGTTITGTFTKGSGNLNDIIVIYISNGSNGRTIMGFNDNDQSDDLRRAVTNAFGNAINFPAGFEATHAIAIKVGNSALFEVPTSGNIGTGSSNNELNFIKAVGSTTSNTQSSFTFSFDWSDIGLTSTDDFGFVITYGNGSGGTNSDAMFSSDEGYGNGIPSSPNPGFNGWTYTTYFDYPSGDIGGLATTAQVGDWSASSTWTNGNVPLAGDEVEINHDVTLDQDATVTSATISSGNTLSSQAGQGRTLTVEDGGGFTNNGTLTANDGMVSFSGDATISGTTTFNNVDIAGGVDFGSGSTIDANLTIESGGFVDTNPPTYSSNSTLIYSDDNTYGRGAEWSATSGAGYPNNVIIQDNTTLDLGNGGAGTAREIAGNLTVFSGSTLSLDDTPMTAALRVKGNFINDGSVELSSSSGGDLILEGDFDDNGTFTANGRAVFFEGGNTQNINSSSNPLEIDVMRINKSGGEVVMDANLLADETQDPLQFSNATSFLNLNGFNLTLGKDDVVSSVA